MADRVQITHPALPDTVVEVRAGAVAGWARSGWVPVATKRPAKRRRPKAPKATDPRSDTGNQDETSPGTSTTTITHEE